MAQDLELADRAVGEPDAVEIEVDDAARIKTGRRDKAHGETVVEKREA
jgi:hypothetical protein